MTYYRLFIASLFPQYDKILYLDCDQAYLNYLCQDKIHTLPNGWNKEPMPLPCEGKKNIVHYALYKKPWQYDDVMDGEYFWQYAKKSPFYAKIRENRAAFGPAERAKKEADAKRIIEHAKATMVKFMKAFEALLKRGETILIYPEQGMWWNYRKPRPMQDGAFSLAVRNNAPVVPIFITMEDSDVPDGDGFFVQEYTLHILPAIYPDKILSHIAAKKDMKNKNYEAWVKVYEEFYQKPLRYGEP